ncbi:class I SAM-dependent methyltransferase [Flavobacterium supellecticarium]|uniref:Class I SAM-dependent methyltransferase n=2 Tax=Flavobacteriaceae TaxID=49546 RepID=A0A4S3ZQ32_9FLAO|nr:class I SAM-dependent methyltransferase [Flavobacterium supellecticarium]
MTKDTIKQIIQKEKFQPGLLGFFINHNFFIRHALKSMIKEKSKLLTGELLDFGCGNKPYLNYFGHLNKYIGVDLKIEGRDENHKYVDRFYDGHVIPFEDNHFDSLLCTEVLEHVFNIDELLKEMNRVLKPNATALITTPFMWEEHEMPHDFARYTTPALKHLYASNGFEVVENHKTGNHVLVLFQFTLNYLNNILPKNKLVKQILMVPFIFTINILGSIFGTILPKSKTVYFNNIFVLRKIK